MDQNPLSPDQAIQYLKARYNKSLRKSYLAKLRSVGGGALFYKIGSAVFYDQTDLDNWVLKNRTPKAASATQAYAIQIGSCPILEESEPHFPESDDGWVEMN